MAQAHRARVEPWVSGHLERRRRGQAHAVNDFLFDYYPYSPGKLATWHPGYGIVLEGPQALEYLKYSGYREVAGGVTADIAWLDSRRDRLDSAIAILDASAGRPPMSGCFALHEWAMVSRLEQNEVRHTALPLRLAPAQIAEAVDEIGLRCTHFDAFRFFTADAEPLNTHALSRSTQVQFEQPGCIHASMDLYKYASWFSPLVSSDLVMDCFENAALARELDMRSSPYDVSEFGLTSIRIETSEGRQEYLVQQQAMIQRTTPLRSRLADALKTLARAHDTTECGHGIARP